MFIKKQISVPNLQPLELECLRSWHRYLYLEAPLWCLHHQVWESRLIKICMRPPSLDFVDNEGSTLPGMQWAYHIKSLLNRWIIKTLLLKPLKWRINWLFENIYYVDSFITSHWLRKTLTSPSLWVPQSSWSSQPHLSPKSEICSSWGCWGAHAGEGAGGVHMYVKRPVGSWAWPAESQLERWWQGTVVGGGMSSWEALVIPHPSTPLLFCCQTQVWPGEESDTNLSFLRSKVISIR